MGGLLPYVPLNASSQATNDKSFGASSFFDCGMRALKLLSPKAYAFGFVTDYQFQWPRSLQDSFWETAIKSTQNAIAILQIARRTFFRITRMDSQILYGAYVRPLLEYANPVVYSGRTKDAILIVRVQRAAKKMVAGSKSVDYETCLAVLDLLPLEHRRLRQELIPTYALFKQDSANMLFTVDPANTRRRHV
ncbi:hypothetical protein CLF_108536 [Clonorchis sinensis]|uniref:Pol-related protein n=1 Tax=Clonorchis sinensis TaxID=79923 RepID=G7YRP4_CLOSI|nr:hypothetical protein CLF_108536 [Clonorchis sinensis]